MHAPPRSRCARSQLLAAAPSPRSPTSSTTTRARSRTCRPQCPTSGRLRSRLAMCPSFSTACWCAARTTQSRRCATAAVAISAMDEAMHVVRPLAQHSMKGSMHALQRVTASSGINFACGSRSRLSSKAVGRAKWSLCAECPSNRPKGRQSACKGCLLARGLASQGLRARGRHGVALLGRLRTTKVRPAVLGSCDPMVVCKGSTYGLCLSVACWSFPCSCYAPRRRTSGGLTARRRRRRM